MMTQASGQNAQALFMHLRDGIVLNMTSNYPLTEVRDANGERHQRICERPRDYSNRCRRWTCSEDVADAGYIIFYHEVQGTADWAERVRKRFLCESNRACADMGLQGANFACFRGDKTRRGTTAPNLVQCREQPRGRIHSEIVTSNSDTIYAYNTFNSTCTGMEHERDTD
ncbi:MAG: hypothetical protein EZS28_016218 [Streblomastix strix]|uniref:Uncharacterized protein n=1 Tax=Streblomastix strix TaxID=222440 RepID=A0A5J4VZZ4_9EUKA|nr:MAG: hypothetical protein EZS28_016218 [Streblomastix strix]